MDLNCKPVCKDLRRLSSTNHRQTGGKNSDISYSSIRSCLVHYTFPSKKPLKLLGIILTLLLLYSYFRMDSSRNVLGGLLGPDVVAEGVLHVDETEVTALGDSVDSGEVFVAELNALKVGLNTRGVGALGENNVAAAQTPGNEDLGEGVTALLGDLVQSLVVTDPLTGGGDLVLRAQGRVGNGQNVLGEAVLDQLLVGEEGVNLDLVDVRRHLGELGHLLEAGDGPVGDTNGLGLALLINLLHGAPCGLGVLGEIL